MDILILVLSEGLPSHEVEAPTRGGALYIMGHVSIKVCIYWRVGRYIFGPK